MDAKRIKLSGGKNDDGDSNIPIRTLCVSPVNVDMGDQIKCHFEQFGTVNSVEIEQVDNADMHFALVEFKLAETATVVLTSNGSHCINDFDVQVKAAEPWCQPDHILNTLDDDCLRLILSYLNQKDLTNAANVCVRFNEQSKSVFSTKFKKLVFTRSNTGDEFENALKTFGSLAQSIDVTCTLFSQNGTCDTELLPMIARYCTPELKELTFRGFGFKNQLHNTDVKFDSALSKLERLTFIGCQLRGSLNELVSACVDLKVLHIEHSQQYDISKWPKFSKLDELRMINSSHFRSYFTDAIIIMNSKLTKISLIDRAYYRDYDSPKIVDMIVQNNPNLLELEFIWNFDEGINFLESVRCFSQLKSLRVLKLNLSRKSAAPLCAILTGMESIEHLKLVEGSIDDQSIDGILKMERLKVLELSNIYFFTDEHLIQLAKGLGSQLEKLELEHSTGYHLTTIGLKKMLPYATKLSLLTLKSTKIIIDADDYKAMLHTVQKRQGKDTLKIELTGKGGQVRVDESVLMENRDIFYIDEKVNFNYISI